MELRIPSFFIFILQDKFINTNNFIFSLSFSQTGTMNPLWMVHVTTDHIYNHSAFHVHFLNMKGGTELQYSFFFFYSW